MFTKFTGRFSKDLDKITQVSIKKNVAEIILEIEAANNFSEIKDLKKLKGHSNAYRVRSGNYRIGLFIENGIVEFVRIVDRKDIYKVFP
jgi:mRNA interferase RelE/StbE